MTPADGGTTLAGAAREALCSIHHPLVVVAHPDDETLYFGGLLLAFDGRADVLCVTDGDFEGQGEARRAALVAAARALGARRAEQWLHADHPARSLPVDDIVAELCALQDARAYDAVFTHAPHGEYGHINHMDVSIAVHRAFAERAPVYVIAGLLLPHLRVPLCAEAYAAKVGVATSVYLGEARKARAITPPLGDEAFTRLSLAEAERVYAHCAEGEPLDDADLDAYRPCAPLLRRTPRSPR